jgi:hypothetical protein
MKTEQGQARPLFMKVPSEMLVETTAKNSYSFGNESNGDRVFYMKSLRPLPMLRSNLL